MHRPIHRWLLSLLLLLALVAGGAMVSTMGPSSVADMSDMSHKSCTSCGKATAPSSCDAVCVTLPGLEPAAPDLDPASSQAQWTLSSETGVTHVIAPDTSPPRA